MYALQRRAKDCGITVSSLHPGIVSCRNPSVYCSCMFSIEYVATCYVIGGGKGLGA